MTKTNEIKIDSIPNDELKNLVYYNVVFHYHNEPIELLTYYLNNMKYLFDNMILNSKIKIEFCVNFFVSNLDTFIELLGENKFTNNNIHKKITHRIYENNNNYVETKFVDTTPTYYNFEIRIHQIMSKPNKNITDVNYNNIYRYVDDEFNFKSQKIEKSNIIDGTNSIGFKRYVANIMTWNIYEKLKNNNVKEKMFNNIQTFLFQIDFGTIIGLHILLHPSITNVSFDNTIYNLTNDNSFNNLSNKVYSFNKKNLPNKNNTNLSGNLNYWYESKQFLLSNKFIIDSYSINDTDDIETIYSNYDFFYFVLTHLDTVIHNFNIVHFTALSIKNIAKPININYDNSELKINSIPYKPNSYYDDFDAKLYKQHYDKFYITDIGLTYLYQNDISKPITYNKNYTSFSEDLLYSSLLLKLKKLIIPHPFLNVTKCSYKNISVKNNKNVSRELIYIFLPQDDIGNYKIFDIINYTQNKKHNIRLTEQNDGIADFIKNIKMKNTINIINGNDDIYAKINYGNKMNNSKIDNNLISCNIQNMTDPHIYISKYSNSKFLFDEFNKITHLEKNKLFNNNNYLLIEYNNMIIIFNSLTNIYDYKLLISKSKNKNIITYYNDKYEFFNIKYKIQKSIKIKYDKLTHKIIYPITKFIYDYILDNLWILNHMKKTNLVDLNTNKYDGLNYKLKYIKYKQKYLQLKNI